MDLSAENPSATPRVLQQGETTVTRMAITPDSHWAVTAHSDGTASAWDLTAANPAVNPRVLAVHGEPILDVMISPDSCWVATVSGRQSIRPTGPGKEKLTLRTSSLRADQSATSSLVIENAASPILFSPDGHSLLAANDDKTSLHVWDMTAEKPGDPRTLRLDRSPIRNTSSGGMRLTASMSRNGRWLATTGAGRTCLWDLTVENPTAKALDPAQYGVVNDLAEISPDGHWLVTASNDNTARLWDLMSQDPAAGPILLHGHSSLVSGVTFSPDSRWLVTGWSPTRPFLTKKADMTPRVWDLQARNPASDPLVLNRGSEVVISPDSRWLVTSEEGDKATVWDLTASHSAEKPRIFAGSRLGMGSLKTTSDSRWAVMGGSDGKLHFWDLTAKMPSATARSLSYGAGPGSMFSLSANDRFIIAMKNRQTIVWRWKWDDLLALGKHVGRNLTPGEWEQHFPGEPYRATFPELPIPEDPVLDPIHRAAELNRETTAAEPQESSKPRGGLVDGPKPEPGPAKPEGGVEPD